MKALGRLVLPCCSEEVLTQIFKYGNLLWHLCPAIHPIKLKYVILSLITLGIGPLSLIYLPSCKDNKANKVI